MSAADRWGLLGLLAMIKSADLDQNLLGVGTDLGTMGLDMQHQGCVLALVIDFFFRSFISVFLLLFLLLFFPFLLAPIRREASASATDGLIADWRGRNLYSTFITPWADASAAHAVEPDFHLPACYNVQPPAPGPNKAAAFSDDTLFFMFYSAPRDALQEVAAQELCVAFSSSVAWVPD